MRFLSESSGRHQHHDRHDVEPAQTTAPGAARPADVLDGEKSDFVGVRNGPHILHVLRDAVLQNVPADRAEIEKVRKRKSGAGKSRIRSVKNCPWAAIRTAENFRLQIAFYAVKVFARNTFGHRILTLYVVYE